MDDIRNTQRPAPHDVPDKPSRAEAEAAVRTLIAWAGDDPDSRGPHRHARGGWSRPTRNCSPVTARTPATRFRASSTEVEGYEDIVLVRDIPFVSHCEHHIAPFFGKAHIGYYPRHGVVGLSKLARIVDTFARRLQTQEAMSAQIVEARSDGSLDTRGVAVMIEAEHTCMSMRGVKKHGVSTVTTQFSGVFRDAAERADPLLDAVARREVTRCRGRQAPARRTTSRKAPNSRPAFPPTAC